MMVRTVRGRYVAARGMMLLILPGMFACGSSSDGTTTTTPDPVVPTLESINFALLGSGKVAFQRYGSAQASGVFVIDAGAMRTVYVPLDPFAFGPALSPDGQKLAFTKPAGSTLHDVFVAGLDGNAALQITSFAGNEGAPSWSPDGTKLIMLATSGGATFRDIYSRSPVSSGGDLKQLTTFVLGPGNVFTCPMMDDIEQRATISSQGALAFACLHGEIDVLSSNGVLIASYKPSRTDRQNWPNVFSATLSPDGTEIAFIEFVSDIDAGPRVLSFALKVTSADGSRVSTIATFPIAPGSGVAAGGGYLGSNNKSLCWMPDGSRLVFNLPESATVGHLWVVRRDGTGLAQLTTAPNVWDRSVSCSRS